MQVLIMFAPQQGSLKKDTRQTFLLLGDHEAAAASQR